MGIALHPAFPADPGVYLYWTQSSTGADTNVLTETPLLGNRVDRFEWNGSVLTFDQNIIMLRALQPAFAAEPTPAAGRGNHNGGVIRFGPDGKLYIIIGDVGRRGHLQNLCKLKQASNRTFDFVNAGPRSCLEIFLSHPHPGVTSCYDAGVCQAIN